MANQKLPTIAKVTITVHCQYDEADLEQLHDEIRKWYNNSEIPMLGKTIDIASVIASPDQLAFFMEYAQ